MKKLSILIAVMLAAVVSQAQISFTIGSSTYKAAKSGINMGTQDYFEDYLSKNLIYANPSMQPSQYRIVEEVASGTTTSFTSQNIYDQIPANNVNGATMLVTCHGGTTTCAGGAQGCTGTVTGNTAANFSTSTGPTFTFTPACSTAIGLNDDVNIISPAVTPATTAGNFNFNDFGWNIGGTGTVAIDTTSADLPTIPVGVQPVQCVQMTNTSGQTSSIQTFFDSTSGFLNYNFNGTYNIGTQYKILSGSGLTLGMTVARSGGVNASATATLSGSTWSAASASFTGTEATTITPSTVNITYTLNGTGSVCLVGATLTAAADTNASLLRNQVLTDVEALNPGEIRFHASGIYGQSLLDMLTPASYRQGGNSSTQRPYAAQGPYNPLGYYDELIFAKTAGVSRVSIVLPPTLSAADWSNWVDFLAGGSGTTYGAMRIALGQTTPFTSVFSQINTEVGNEVWNTGTFPGSVWNHYSVSSAAFWNYVPIAVGACQAMKGNTNWSSTAMKCVASVLTALDGQDANTIAALDTSHYIDMQAANEYGQFDVTSCTSPAPWLSSYTEAWANVHDAASTSGMFQTASTSLPVEVYEYNNSTNSGSCTQSQLTGYPEGEGYGPTNVLMPLLMNKVFASTDSNLWQLYQNSTPITTTAASFSLAEWGVKTGPGGAFNNMRPMGYAIGAVNAAILPTGINVTGTNVPTYSPAASNGINAQTNVPYLQAFAFTDGGSNHSVVVTNTDPANAYTFSVNGTNAPTGAVTVTKYSSANLTDNNEGANTTPTNFNTTTSATGPSFSLPAHSLMTIAYTTATSVLTLTANNYEMYAGDQVPPLAYTATVSSGSYVWATSVASGLPTLSTTATASSPAGTYPITITQGTMTANSGWSFTFVAGTMTVKARTAGAGAFYGAHINNSPLHNGSTMMNVKTQTTSCGQAAGDGVTDDTAVINCLILGNRTGPVSGTQPTYTRAPKELYFPAGTYRITGQLSYFGCCEYWVGAGPGNTIFKLDPSVAAFASTATASGVISIPPSNSNQAFANNMEGFTVEIGPGNPKAQGISYAASNYSGISNINIVSDDSVCDTGISMSAAYPGPGMFKNIGVYGCNQAFLFSHAEYSMTAEDITVENQAQFGINSTQLEITFRNVLSYNSVSAWSSLGSSNVLMNAQLDGYGSPVTAIKTGQALQGSTYLRDIHTTGYTNSLVDVGVTPTVTNTSPNITEYWTGTTNCEFCSGQPGALNLPIKETPDPIDDPNPANWTLLGSDPTTWAATVASGTSATISVPVLHNYTNGAVDASNDVNYTGLYGTTGTPYAITLNIPDYVNHFACNGAQFNPSSSALTINVLGSNLDPPFVIDHCAGQFVTINQNSTRTVVVKHMSLTYVCNVAGDFYGEDIEPFGTVGPINFCNNQHVWIRQFDQETDGQQVFLSTTTGTVSMASSVMTINLTGASATNRVLPGMTITFIQMGASSPPALAFMNGTTALVTAITSTSITATPYGQQGQTVPNYAITNCSYANPVLTCTTPFAPVTIPGQTIPLSGFTASSALNGLTATVTSTQTGTSTTFAGTLNTPVANFTGTDAGLGLLTSWPATLQTGGGIAFATVVPKLTCNGCTLWALNYKTEKQTNGGNFTNANVELLGGFQYPLRGSPPGNPVFILNNSNFFTTTQSFGGFQWPNWVTETQGSTTLSFANPQANTSNSSFLSNYTSKALVTLSGVQVTPFGAVMVSGTLQFTATCQYTNGSTDDCAGQTVTWTSSQPTLVTVNSSGLATFVANCGTAGSNALTWNCWTHIVARVGGFSDYATIMMEYPSDTIQPIVTPGPFFNPTRTSTVVVGSIVTIGAGDGMNGSVAGLNTNPFPGCNWAVSNATVGTVNRYGFFTALAPGTDTITCVPAGNGVYATSTPTPTLPAAITLTVVAPPIPTGTTWYVRPDGGTPYSSTNTAGQCNGKTNAAYPGTGTNQACAFGDFEYLYFDQVSGAGTGQWLISGGDTVIVAPKTGGYNVQKTGASTPSNCIDTTNCDVPQIPSGSASNPTRILGSNYASCTGTQGPNSSATVLLGWGREMIRTDLSQFVDVECFYMMPNSQTHVSNIGVVQSALSSFNTFKNIYMIGMSGAGILGASGYGIVWDHTHIRAAFNAGVNMDDAPYGLSNISVAGGLTWTYSTVEFTGCIPIWGSTAQYPYEPAGCEDDNTSGGYGDGFGTASMTGTWLFDHDIWAYNFQDGLDILHSGAQSVTITSNQSYGNNGQQYKFGSVEDMVFQNNFALGNCNRELLPFDGVVIANSAVLPCRAGGVALVTEWADTGTYLFQNNTLLSIGLGMIEEGCESTWATCTNANTVYQNNISAGYTDSNPTYNSGGLPNAFGPSSGGLPSGGGGFATRTNNFFYNTRAYTPLETNESDTNDPSFINEVPFLVELTDATEPTLDNYNFMPSAVSPALGAGINVGIATDANGVPTTTPPVLGPLNFVFVPASPVNIQGRVVISGNAHLN